MTNYDKVLENFAGSLQENKTLFPPLGTEGRLVCTVCTSEYRTGHCVYSPCVLRFREVRDRLWTGCGGKRGFTLDCGSHRLFEIGGKVPGDIETLRKAGNRESVCREIADGSE